MPAAYLDMSPEELQSRADQARELLSPCRLCPRECEVDRPGGQEGYCDTADLALVASAQSHFGEERPLVGSGGSGTIFFAGCNLGCVFCQNSDISHQARGREHEPGRLAQIMLRLQEDGCHNINFVTPSHVVPQILEALPEAIEDGLTVPLVYNTGGYDYVEELKLLDGIVDIYMPDAKYADEETARKLSDAPHYPQVNRAALEEMHRQVGDLQTDDQGVARRGLIVRHLVLPNNLAGTEQVMEFLASLSTNTFINVMDQYRPCFQAHNYEGLGRRLQSGEYQEALQAARDAGLERLDSRNRADGISW